MRYLFFTNTPAHAHLFKHSVSQLCGAGHDVLVLARDDGCTEPLLIDAGLPYEIYGERGTTKRSLAWELPGQVTRIARRARSFDPDLIFGIGPYASVASVVTGAPAIAVLDSETSLDHVVSRPFVDVILTPDAFREELGEKHIRFTGVTELAYLHPNRFETDPTIREELGIGPDERYAIVRFNVLNGHHDVGREGFSQTQLRTLVAELSDHVTVFVSDESGQLEFDTLEARPYDLHPAKIHDTLACADLLVADTQTMVTEAALLGTPAIRSNSYVGEGDMGNFYELERYGLVDNIAEFEEVLARAKTLLTREGVAEKWADRRDAYVADTVDLTSVLCDVAVGSVRPQGRSKRVGEAEQVPVSQVDRTVGRVSESGSTCDSSSTSASDPSENEVESAHPEVIS